MIKESNKMIPLLILFLVKKKLIVDPTKAPKYAELVKQPETNPFHSSEISKTINKDFNASFIEFI